MAVILLQIRELGSCGDLAIVISPLQEIKGGKEWSERLGIKRKNKTR